jgi:hypothetical protein
MAPILSAVGASGVLRRLSSVIWRLLCRDQSIDLMQEGGTAGTRTRQRGASAKWSVVGGRTGAKREEKASLTPRFHAGFHRSACNPSPSMRILARAGDDAPCGPACRVNSVCQGRESRHWDSQAANQRGGGLGSDSQLASRCSGRKKGSCVELAAWKNPSVGKGTCRGDALLTRDMSVSQSIHGGRCCEQGLQG